MPTISLAQLLMGIECCQKYAPSDTIHWTVFLPNEIALRFIRTDDPLPGTLTDGWTLFEPVTITPF